MGTRNTKQILSDLYGLMMEINFHLEDEEVLKELNENPDKQVDKHLVRIKQISAQLKAKANLARFARAKEQISILKQRGVEEIQKLISPEERVQYMPLFRKFEKLTTEDQESIMEDQEFLKMLELLNKKTDDDSK